METYCGSALAGASELHSIRPARHMAPQEVIAATAEKSPAAAANAAADAAAEMAAGKDGRRICASPVASEDAVWSWSGGVRAKAVGAAVWYGPPSERKILMASEVRS